MRVAILLFALVFVCPAWRPGEAKEPPSAASDPATEARRRVAFAEGDAAVDLLKAGRIQEGVAALETLDAAYRKDKDPSIRYLLGQALMHRALAYFKADQAEVSIALYGQVESRLGGSKLPWQQELLSEALRDQVGMHLYLRRYAEVAKAADAFDARFSAVREPEVRARLATVQLLKVEALYRQQRYEEQLPILDAVLSRFGLEKHRLIRASLARAQANKGDALHRLGRSDEALRAYDLVEQEFREEPADETREMVAWAKLRKSVLLTELKRDKEAKRNLSEIVDRYGSNTHPPIQRIVANARDLLAGKG